MNKVVYLLLVLFRHVGGCIVGIGIGFLPGNGWLNLGLVLFGFLMAHGVLLLDRAVRAYGDGASREEN